jgi:sialic acid synthase SpsE
VNEIKSGNAISEKDIRRIRPGFGLAPKYFDELIGKRVNRDIVRGTAVTWDLIDD